MMDDQPHKDNSVFRFIIGALSLGGALGGFAALYLVAIPAGNRDAMMLALGIVMGWGSSVVASEYGASATGRKVADTAIRQIERRNITDDIAAAAPAEVKVVNTADDPANVTEAKP